MPDEDLVELKFRLYDGSDIGPIRYSSAYTVEMLKERIVAEWPRDKKIVPKTANDVKLISGGKILENNKTVGQCGVPFGDLPGGVITMHVVVQPSLTKTKTDGIAAAGCVIRDCMGRPLVACATPLLHMDILKAELWGLRRGILLAVDMGLKAPCGSKKRRSMIPPGKASAHAPYCKGEETPLRALQSCGMGGAYTAI
ncbi:hypothetical protein HHK36_029375 [Tetracentron sinense]|uniref:Ubiquitin-like domain-containing protein n=1 Tax=Tetracentron sinense TaxID=13715 RepID=A0A835CZK2_TETSI|nr:hypothetical protein HHK36_029375 [Tetracentron sinense]